MEIEVIKGHLLACRERPRRAQQQAVVERGVAYMEIKGLRTRPAGSPEAAFSARSCLRLAEASTSLGQPAARAALAPRPHRPCCSHRASPWAGPLELTAEGMQQWLDQLKRG